MIALRGILHEVENEDGKNKIWKCSGMWTFGQLPDHVGRDLNSIRLKIPNVRPFEYTWDEECSADSVYVPSFAPTKISKNEEGEEKKEGNDVDKKNESKNDEEDQKEYVVSSNVYVSTDFRESSSLKDGKEKIGTDTDEREKVSVLNQVKREEKTNVLESRPEEKKREEEIAKKVEHEKIPTFADVPSGSPAYTEASIKFPDECPKDGKWKGYFENIVRGRKAHNQVPEIFSMFFNATPSPDSKILFAPPQGTIADKTILNKCADTKKEDLLPEGCIHVRGVGTNQYGTFDLLGSFDRKTKILELQRMYIMADNPSPKTSPSKKKTATNAAKNNKDLNASNSNKILSSSGGGTRSSYSTRKRQLSWQRRSSLSDDEDEIVGMRRHSIANPKKRARASSVASDKGGTLEPSHPQSTSTKLIGSSMTPTTTTSSKKTSVKAASSVVGSKKRGSQGNRCVTAISNNTIRLPSVGDPMEARWRAAHFLYYQRHDVQDDEGENVSNGKSPTDKSGAATNEAITFVVYEGEMSQGNCLRDGRGVCLYNNGILYEGEFKKDREHGKGTLMSADRKSIIYKGDWEKGKIHGQGTYYFRDDDSILLSSASMTSSSSQEVSPRYEGEFKENCRHGLGKYFLPDGSTYEGEWRDNIMTGRGTFVWPDGSLYIGQWKDGMRHGQGMLRASDKFTYDGMWVYNTMEGRGIATYPGGQTYEGLWANGRREGRGTIQFVNGSVYEGRFRDDAIEGQGTMKMSNSVIVKDDGSNSTDKKEDWMIPISFQSDMEHIHQKAGFTMGGD